jgi:hypothetical protein
MSRQHLQRTRAGQTPISDQPIKDPTHKESESTYPLSLFWSGQSKSGASERARQTDYFDEILACFFID